MEELRREAIGQREALTRCSGAGGENEFASLHLLAETQWQGRLEDIGMVRDAANQGWELAQDQLLQVPIPSPPPREHRGPCDMGALTLTLNPSCSGMP